MTEVKSVGISKTVFIVGLIAAILASSLISAVIVTQLPTANGPRGDKGDKGDTGGTGATGATGATGPQGPQGLQGVQGLQGLQGLQGIQGQRGDTGPKGPAGVFSIGNMSGWLQAPAYESPWFDVITIRPITLNHNLNTYRLFVQIYMNITFDTGRTVVFGRGGDLQSTWILPTENSIEVYWTTTTHYNVVSDYMKVLIWKIQ